jgi:hypothetical protein
LEYLGQYTGGAVSPFLKENYAQEPSVLSAPRLGTFRRFATEYPVFGHLQFET